MIVIAALLLLAVSPDAETGKWITAQGGDFATDPAGHITSVDLASSWITDVDLARVGQLEHLQKLDLSHTLITDVGLEHLKKLRNVTDLNLYYAEYFTDSGLAHLTAWKKLLNLNLHGTKVTSKVFDHLARLTTLRSLDIGFTQIDDDGFENLAPLVKLERLVMGGNRLTGSCLSTLRLLPALTDLDAGGVQWVDSGVWGLPLTEANLQQIGALKQLKSLSLNGATVTDRGADKPGQAEAERKELRGLAELSGLVNLERLDLSRTPVSPANLEPLRAMPKLRDIRLEMAPNINGGTKGNAGQWKR